MVDTKKIDSNNMKAMGILKHVLYCADNGGDATELDIVTTLEAVLDYLIENDHMLNEGT
ncbi:MAG: hypothetical protein IKW21_02395 [Lachnospiraceae bacterium]|nr:hypothetical protein [Lachnospiraceae bacterium]